MLISFARILRFDFGRISAKLPDFLSPVCSAVISLPYASYTFSDYSTVLTDFPEKILGRFTNEGNKSICLNSNCLLEERVFCYRFVLLLFRMLSFAETFFVAALILFVSESGSVIFCGII